MGTLTAYTRLVANEPSVGMYFVQEHVRKSVPFVVSAKVRRSLGKSSTHETVCSYV